MKTLTALLLSLALCVAASATVPKDLEARASKAFQDMTTAQLLEAQADLLALAVVGTDAGIPKWLETLVPGLVIHQDNGTGNTQPGSTPVDYKGWEDDLRALIQALLNIIGWYV